MRSKNLLLILILTLSVFSACTQTRVIKKVNAFSQEIHGGANLQDEKGNSLNNIQYKIYVYFESAGSDKPVITQASYKGKVYKNPSVYLVKERPIEVGNRLSDQKPVVLNPSKGTTTWRIEFIVNDTMEEGSATIVVKGVKENRPFSFKINTVSLAPYVGM